MSALDRDETFAEQLARISSTATPNLDKLTAFAADFRVADLEEKLAEAKQHRDHYNGLYRETRDMAAERETFQGREATMAAAMRYKSQALVWEREVYSLTAQIAGQQFASCEVLTSAQLRAVDDTAGLEPVGAAA
jgi:hypothetical protein